MFLKTLESSNSYLTGRRRGHVQESCSSLWTLLRETIWPKGHKVEQTTTMTFCIHSPVRIPQGTMETKQHAPEKVFQNFKRKVFRQKPFFYQYSKLYIVKGICKCSRHGKWSTFISLAVLEASLEDEPWLIFNEGADTAANVAASPRPRLSAPGNWHHVEPPQTGKCEKFALQTGDWR